MLSCHSALVHSTGPSSLQAILYSHEEQRHLTTKHRTEATSKKSAFGINNDLTVSTRKPRPVLKTLDAEQEGE